MSTSASSQPPSNPWLKGPPQQLKAAAAASPQQGTPASQPGSAGQGQSLTLPPPPPAVALARSNLPRVGRAHHHLSVEEAQYHAFQLGIAQQMALAALQTGMDLAVYQAQVAMSFGFDPRILTIIPEPGTRLDGSEPALGLTLVRDEQAYTHIELLSRYPHLATINLTSVDTEPRKAAYFLVTCPERQVHESIKYGYWSISAEGAPALNRTFGEMHGVGPVYFLLASTDSVAFSGIAQMIAPASPANPEQPEGVHRMPVRWIFCKNIPFSHMNFIALRPTSKEAEEQRKIHGGMQPLKLSEGNRALQSFARYVTGTSVLMDFKYYDEAEARGAVVESGEAAVRAAQKQQQRMMHGGGSGAPHHHTGGGGGRGGHFHSRPHYHHHQHHHQNHHQSQQQGFNLQQNQAAFPTPAQAASTQTQAAQPTQSAQQPQQQQQQQHSGRNPRFEGRGGHRGSSSRPGPSRTIMTADEERVNLQAKYVFEPVVKEKQSRRRRGRNAGGQMDEEGNEYGEEVGQGQGDSQQLEGEQAGGEENDADEVNGEQ